MPCWLGLAWTRVCLWALNLFVKTRGMQRSECVADRMGFGFSKIRSVRWRASGGGEGAAGSQGARAGDAGQGRWSQLPLHQCAEGASGGGESAAGGRGMRAGDAYRGR